MKAIKTTSYLYLERVKATGRSHFTNQVSKTHNGFAKLLALPSFSTFQLVTSTKLNRTLDLTVVFDTVSDGILLGMVSRLGISGLALA